MQQFYAMFLKRALYSTRNWKVMVAQFLVPLIFTIVALVVARTLPSQRDTHQMSLALGRYGATRVPVALESDVGPLASVLANMYGLQLPAQQGHLVNVTGKQSTKTRSWVFSLIVCPSASPPHPVFFSPSPQTSLITF